MNAQVTWFLNGQQIRWFQGSSEVTWEESLMSYTSILFANNARSTLAQPLGATSTTLTLSQGTGALFPIISAVSEYFVLTLNDANTGLLGEIMWVTATDGDVFTVLRGLENTTPLNWDVGDIASNYWTAGSAASLTAGAGQPKIAAGSADQLLGPPASLGGAPPVYTVGSGLTFSSSELEVEFGTTTGTVADGGALAAEIARAEEEEANLQTQISSLGAPTVTTGLTASGTTQGTALQLPSLINEFDSVPPNTGGIFKLIPIGISVTIYNRDPANVYSQWPLPGHEIESLGVNEPDGIAPGGQGIYCRVGETQWRRTV